MNLIIEIDEEVYSHAKDVYNRTLTPNEEIIIRDSIVNAIPLNSIISDIEQARDKDKLCEYPYNRCINIIKKAVGDES